MVVKQVRGDIFSSPHPHIVFAVNTEGYNDAGFAGAVSGRYWSELANTGKKKLGDVLHKTVGDKTFHAVVCHSLDRGGWDNTPQIVEKALNELDIPKDETVGVVLMGSGMIGQMQGADVRAILSAMERSKKSVTVYSL